MSQAITPHIRDFTTQDLPAVFQIHHVSFSDEMRAQGETPADAERRIRIITIGNMVPFKVLMRLAQRRWALLVAEVVGRVVGLGGFFGTTQAVEFGPLMVLPEYRRQSIGSALTRARIARAAQMGIAGAYAGPLITNQASLGNLSKNGFTVYRYRTGYEVALPWTQAVVEPDVVIRPVQTHGKERLQKFESRAFGAERLAREGSQVEALYPSWAYRIYSRLLAGRTALVLVAEHAGQVVATVEIYANADTPKGAVYLEKDPDTASAAVELALLNRAANWLTQQGKRATQVFVPGQVAPPEFAMPEHRYCWAYMSRRLEKL